MVAKNKKISMNDLALMTGFSMSTVSKALNNKGRISEKTRKIILDKAKEHNFIADYPGTPYKEYAGYKFLLMSFLSTSAIFKSSKI